MAKTWRNVAKELSKYARELEKQESQAKPKNRTRQSSLEFRPPPPPKPGPPPPPLPRPPPLPPSSPLPAKLSLPQVPLPPPVRTSNESPIESIKRVSLALPHLSERMSDAELLALEGALMLALAHLQLAKAERLDRKAGR